MGIDTSAAPSLEELMQAVVLQHPSALSALAQARAAQEDINTARWRFYPAPSLQVESGSGRPITTARLTQPLWTGGRLTSQLRQAEETSRAGVAAALETRRQLARRVLDTWQQYTAASDRLGVSEDALRLLQRYEELMQRRVSADVSPRIELDLLKARSYQERINRTNAAATASAAAQAISLLLGQPWPLEPWPAGQLAALSSRLPRRMAMPNAEELSAMVEQHPAVVRALHEARASEAQALAVEAGLWPQVYLSLQKVSSSTQSNPTSLVLGLQYAPDAGLGLAAQMRASRARAESLMLAVETARRDAANSFHADWEEFTSTREREEGLLAAVTSAQAVVESYERQFVAGKRSWQDVLNAARELSQNQAALADARAASVVLAYRLRMLRGEFAWQQGAIL